MTAPLHAVQHASDSAEAQRAETPLESAIRAGTAVQVEGRRDRPAWRATRAHGASILSAVLHARRGAAAEWAQRLGIHHSRVADYTAPDGSRSPTIADVLLLPATDALRYLDRLREEVLGVPHTTDLLGESIGAVSQVSSLLASVHAALRDESLDGHERAQLLRQVDVLRERLNQIERVLRRSP